MGRRNRDYCKCRFCGLKQFAVHPYVLAEAYPDANADYYCQWREPKPHLDDYYVYTMVGLKCVTCTKLVPSTAVKYPSKHELSDMRLPADHPTLSENSRTWSRVCDWLLSAVLVIQKARIRDYFQEQEKGRIIETKVRVSGGRSQSSSSTDVDMPFGETTTCLLYTSPSPRD
mgnify:CR=1 FL=1